jgi:hypothetical protein
VGLVVGLPCKCGSAAAPSLILYFITCTHQAVSSPLGANELLAAVKGQHVALLCLHNAAAAAIISAVKQDSLNLRAA